MNEERVLAEETYSILHSVARIMQAKKHLVFDLPQRDALGIALFGELLGLTLELPLDENYLKELLDTTQDFVADNKDRFQDLLVLNQSRVLEAVMGGMV